MIKNVHTCVATIRVNYHMSDAGCQIFRSVADIQNNVREIPEKEKEDGNITDIYKLCVFLWMTQVFI